MNTSDLTISNAISAGWEKAKNNLGLWIGALLILFAISIGFSILSGINNVASALNNDGVSGAVGIFAVIAFCISVGQYALQNLTSIGLTRIQLNLIDGKAVGVGQLFKSEGMYWRYLFTTIVYGLIIVGGLLLLIVPGIIWGIKYQFAMTLVVDKKIKLGEAISMSGKITKGHKGWLFGFGIIVFLINLGGLLALGIGLLFTIPLTAMAHIWVYRQLMDGAGAEGTMPSEVQPASQTVV